MLLGRERPRLSGGKRKDWGLEKKKQKCNLMALSIQHQRVIERVEGVWGARSPETPQLTGHLQSWSHPDGARGGFWWLLGGRGGGLGGLGLAWVGTVMPQAMGVGELGMMGVLGPFLGHHSLVPITPSS